MKWRIITLWQEISVQCLFHDDMIMYVPKGTQETYKQKGEAHTNREGHIILSKVNIILIKPLKT